MKDVYKNVNDFIEDVMPIEFRMIQNRESAPEKRGSDSTVYKFEKKLMEILAEEDEGEGEK
ncbi:MAG: hypothetical protein FWH35_00735 [Treponema sp.]|nr:hypothetical protein [Treponema sp.]